MKLKPFGWIIYNGNLPGNKFRDFAEMLQEAAYRACLETSLIPNNASLCLMDQYELGILDIPEQKLPDFVIFTDKDIYLAKQLELLGIRVFNGAEAIAISDDKIATYQMLAAHGLAIPKTIIAPKEFNTGGSVPPHYLYGVAETLHFPLVIKEAFGSFGEQVYLIHNEEQLHSKTAALRGKPFLFQAYVANSHGRDIRLQVVGDQVPAAMKRTSKTDFRANVTTGGTTQPYEPTEEEIALAIAGTKAIGADFAGVDILFGDDDRPIICEINSNAHIRSMLVCTGINCADSIIEYINSALERTS
nr:RimK family alpha-L-glutamate ligase [Ornithinibacillus gellani]